MIFLVEHVTNPHREQILHPYVEKKPENSNIYNFSTGQAYNIYRITFSFRKREIKVGEREEK